MGKPKITAEIESVARNMWKRSAKSCSIQSALGDWDKWRQVETSEREMRNHAAKELETRTSGRQVRNHADQSTQCGQKIPCVVGGGR